MLTRGLNAQQTQETLIRAFQKENKQLMLQLKKLQQGAQYDLHVENEQLRKQLLEARDDAEKRVASDNNSTGQYRAAVEARLHAEAQALCLREELDAEHAAHRERENELKVALDRVKKAKVELECRYEGIDLEKIADETKRVRELQADLERAKKESEHALASLQKKLDWYVENQRLLDAQDDELKRLKEEVKQVTAELAALRSQHRQGSGTPGKSTPHQRSSSQSTPFHHHRSAADVRRISELENRLLEMEEAMRKRHPDSLVNLILASRKAEEESTVAAMDAEFQERLKAKDEEIEQLQEANEKKLMSFRQQQEKLVLLFQKRIREQEKQLQQAESHRHHTRSSVKRQTTSAEPHAKSADDDEVKRVRKFYTEKIKDVEKKWEAKYRSLKKQQFGGVSGAAAVDGLTREFQGLSYADSTVIILNLQRQLREREAETKQLTAQVRMLEDAGGAGTNEAADKRTRKLSVPHDISVEKEHMKYQELSAYVRSVEAQLKASEEARAHLVQTLSTLQTFSMEQASIAADVRDHEPQTNTVASELKQSDDRARVRAELTAQFKREVELKERAHKDELLRAAERVERQMLEQREAWEKALQTQAALHASEVQRLEQLVSAGEQEKRELRELAAGVPFLESEVVRLREQLAVPRTPSMVQYRSLEMKIETLMQKHLLREAELKVLLSKATQSSELEKLQLERVHQTAIAAKNVEIRHFKQQVRRCGGRSVPCMKDLICCRVALRRSSTSSCRSSRCCGSLQCRDDNKRVIY